MKISHYVIQVHRYMTTYIQVWRDTVVDVGPTLLFLEGWKLPKVRTWVRKHKGRIRKQPPPRRIK